MLLYLRTIPRLIMKLTDKLVILVLVFYLAIIPFIFFSVEYWIKDSQGSIDCYSETTLDSKACFLTQSTTTQSLIVYVLTGCIWILLIVAGAVCYDFLYRKKREWRKRED